jgi:hypothetical protein
VKGSLDGEFLDIDSPLKVLDADGKAIGAIETSKKNGWQNGPFYVFDIYAGEMRVATGKRRLKIKPEGWYAVYLCGPQNLTRERRHRR